MKKECAGGEWKAAGRDEARRMSDHQLPRWIGAADKSNELLYVEFPEPRPRTAGLGRVDGVHKAVIGGISDALRQTVYKRQIVAISNEKTATYTRDAD